MRIAHGGVGEQQFFLIQHPLLHRIGALFVQNLLQAGAKGLLRLREAGNVILVALGVGVGHLNFGDIAQDAGSPVTGVHKLKQLRRLVDKLGVAPACDKGGVCQNIGDKGNVGLNAPDAHLVDGPGRLAAGSGEGAIPACYLHQKGVIVGRNNGAHTHIAAVQTDAEAAGGMIGGDLAVIGGKIVRGVLGGHPALDGVTVEMYILLLCQADFRAVQGESGSHQQLGAHDVNACDHFGNGVLHLNAGIHLDEVVVAGLVHQKLHRAGADITHGLGDLHGVAAQSLHRLLGHRPGRGKLHHLLIPALKRAVALTQVVNIAVFIG